jgi:hypothetical protein
MSRFKIGICDWTQYFSKLNLSEKDDQINLHFGKGCKPHYESMAEVEMIVERGLKEAQLKGRPYLVFNHGWHTSGRGRTSARSVVRGFMRSKAATPLIERKDCIQHVTIFVAKLRSLTPMPVD